MSFKLWFLTQGAPYTAWALYLMGAIFLVLTKWVEEKRYFFWGALVLFALGTFIINVMIQPWNWQVLYNVGGIE